MPVEILGSIYEQFLGKTIRFRGVKGNKHTAIIEEKPEVKKAGGVYYTPEHIVKYIVERTVGEMLKGKTPEAVAKMKIIDPSCGSGSFLVGSYSYLLNWHLDYYTKDKQLKKALKEGAIYEATAGTYKLTIEKKQSILLNNIFGLDIDEQAVEVSKLSLYLKLLEDEGREAASKEELFKHTDFKFLPSLMGNIKCGNALVESDYYLNTEPSLFLDLDAMREVNTFDWQDVQKGFGKILEAGGFDCVIGNPPYVSAPTQLESAKLRLQREYLANCKKYVSLYQKWDLYIPFIEKGLSILKDKGVYSSIIPYPFTNQNYGFLLRNLILQDYNLIEVVDLKGTKVFEHATVTNCIPIIRKEKAKNTVAISHINEEKNIGVSFEKQYAELVIDEKNGVWNLEKENKDAFRHKNLNLLGDFCYISYGLAPCSDEKTAKGAFKKSDLLSNFMDETHSRKYIEGKDISRYSINRVRFIEYGTRRSPSKLRRQTFSEWYEVPKILVNRLGILVSSLDINNKFIHNDSIIGLALWKDLKGVENKSVSGSVKRYSRLAREEMEALSEKVSLNYLLTILNSKYGKYLLSIQRGGDYHIYPEHIRNIPIPIAEQKDMDALSEYAKQELALHQKLKEVSLPQDKIRIENTIKALDDGIDKLVYKIYGLSEEEISKL